LTVRRLSRKLREPRLPCRRQGQQGTPFGRDRGLRTWSNLEAAYTRRISSKNALIMAFFPATRAHLRTAFYLLKIWKFIVRGLGASCLRIVSLEPRFVNKLLLAMVTAIFVTMSLVTMCLELLLINEFFNAIRTIKVIEVVGLRL
jgi:hypothetical protein